MLFKNLVFYRFTQPFTWTADQLTEALQESVFVPCLSQEASKYGWTTPAGALDERLVVEQGGCLLICLKKEEKILPSSVVKDQLLEKVKAIEEEQDRKVRKKERDSLKDEITFELLPKAFSRFKQTFAYIDAVRGLLVVDATTAKSAENLTSFLRKTLGSLPITIPAMCSAPAAIMTDWVARGDVLPEQLRLTDECELVEPREAGGKAKCQRQDLESPEVAEHLKAGKQVVKLGLDYQTKLGFTLGDDLIVRKLYFCDSLLEKAAEAGAEDALAALEADFFMMQAELGELIPALLRALGGENSEAYPAAIDPGSDPFTSLRFEASTASALSAVAQALDDDPLYVSAVAFVRSTKRSAITSVQREFKIGYSRAARLIDQMESAGVVSEAGHNGARTVVA